MRLRSFSGRCLTSIITVVLVVALTFCSCVEKIFPMLNPSGNMNNSSSYLGATGPGAWDVVQEALNLESQLSPPSGLNDYDPFSKNQYIAAAVNYWKGLCSFICAAAVPKSYQYVHDELGSSLVNCGTYCSDGFQCAMYVETVYHLAGHTLPQDDNAVDFYTNYAHIPGWQVLPVATNLPLPGDMVVWSHATYGHVAIVVDVQPPTEGSPLGTVTVAQANGPATLKTPNANLSSWINDHAPDGTWLLQMPLTLHQGASATQDTYSLDAGWGSSYNILGYVRNPSLDSTNTPAGDLVRTPQWGGSADVIAQYDGNTSGPYSRVVWQNAACSAATMAEVINAYNTYFKRNTGKNAKPYRIADILRKEVSVGEITSDQGLLNPGFGMADTFAQFHFNAFWGGHDSADNVLSLDQIIAIANTGIPVIVGLDQGMWAQGGHYMVVQGGDQKNIQLVDSSWYNYQTVDRKKFSTWWSGLFIIAYPDDEPGMPTDDTLRTRARPVANYGVSHGVWQQLAYMDAVQVGISPTYYVRQIAVESSFNANASDTGPSNNRDIGIAQASPSTIVGYNLRDPIQALAGAAKYDAKNFHTYLGSDQTPNGELEAYRKTFAAYNGGTGLVAEQINSYKSKWLTSGSCDIRNYVNQVMVGLGQFVC